MDYDFRNIERRWQDHWENKGIYRVTEDPSKPSFYVLDMFPYPSGAGLHVGHPLGYIASDIFSRYKRLKGFNVLHPMGFDSFGLPAEQYALETGQHPADTTEKNISTFKQQLRKIGFCYDWSREVQTSDPAYYRWTQWIFLQLFKSWYNTESGKAEPIETLVTKFESGGSKGLEVPDEFTADEWENFTGEKKEEILMNFRLAYSAYGEVNWCEALGTVLANDEVVNGVSERGGFPVVRKKMRQWFMRITAYADRLLAGLDSVNFTESMKEMQRNWIGKSQGAEINFSIHDSPLSVKVYTTRPETIFGADFIVLAPEHELLESIVTPGRQREIDEYLAYVKTRSERERMSDVKQVTGSFTGAYAIHPFTKRKLPVYIAEYVLAGYGTGAIMAVPSGDQRDFLFARQMGIEITNIIGDAFSGEEANPSKDIPLTNSSFLNGLLMKDAVDVILNAIAEQKIGIRKVNYRMRDAGFSRQRYWGEPFPIVWDNGSAQALSENELPLLLPHVKSYGPGPEGEGPLANLYDWTELPGGAKRETSTMPGYAGSSWYFLRFMDPGNKDWFCDSTKCEYWGQVDVYIGGTEHAVGHLLYSRMWTKFLFDRGWICFEEPFKKLVNQGMIQGSSRFVHRISGTNKYVSFDLLSGDKYNGEAVDRIHVDVNIVDGVVLDKEAFRKWKPMFHDVEFIDGPNGFTCAVETEKMSKTKFNTVNPDDLVDKYGADTFRMYEMFLGPVEQSKPWDTKGIEGVHRFLRKLWRLFYNDKGAVWNQEEAGKKELKALHKAIKKIDHDTESFSFNTAVSTFMVLVNELTDLGCHKKEILSPMLALLSPYAPHISEELWHALGNQGSVLDASFPEFNEDYLTEDTIHYPVSINGKLRTGLDVETAAGREFIEAEVLKNEIVLKWLEGKQPKKIIFVPGKMINVVV